MKLTTKEGKHIFDEADVNAVCAELEGSEPAKDVITSLVFATLMQRKPDVTLALQGAFVAGILFERKLMRVQKEQRNATS